MNWSNTSYHYTISVIKGIVGKAERQQLNDFIDFLKSKHDSNMPEDDDLD